MMMIWFQAAFYGVTTTATLLFIVAAVWVCATLHEIHQDLERIGNVLWRSPARFTSGRTK